LFPGWSAALALRSCCLAWLFRWSMISTSIMMRFQSSHQPNYCIASLLCGSKQTCLLGAFIYCLAYPMPNWSRIVINAHAQVSQP
jgi:hypothetical protein